MGIKKFAATLAAVVMAFSCMAVSASAAETATCNKTMTTPHSLLLLAIGEDPIPQVVQKQTLPVHTSSPIPFATEALMCMSMDMTQTLANGWIAQIKPPVGSLT